MGTVYTTDGPGIARVLWESVGAAGVCRAAWISALNDAEQVSACVGLAASSFYQPAAGEADLLVVRGYWP